MTDFLDRLEADLRTAALRRRRRRRPARVLKTAAAAAVVALMVVAGGRVVDGLGTTEETADRPASVPQLSRDDAPVAVIPAGQASASQVIMGTLARSGYQVGGRSRTAPDDLPSMVLYRPAAQKVAAGVADRLRIGVTRPLTVADEARLGGRLAGVQVVVVYGFDLQDRTLLRFGTCRPAGGALRLCAAARGGVMLTAFFDGKRRLDVESPGPSGHWRWAALSPDGRTILAQWTAECEVPQAYMIDAEGGRPRLTGEVAEALGWTPDGRAVVFLPPDRGCGGDDEPGVYLVTTDGERELVIAGEQRPAGLNPSIRPFSPR